MRIFVWFMEIRENSVSQRLHLQIHQSASCFLTWYIEVIEKRVDTRLYACQAILHAHIHFTLVRLVDDHVVMQSADGIDCVLYRGGRLRSLDGTRCLARGLSCWLR